MRRYKSNSWQAVFAAALAVGGTVQVVVAADQAAGSSFEEHVEFGTGPTIPVAWGDCNNDGHLDLAVGNFGGVNKLYVSNGDGTFTGENLLGGLAATFAVVWGDYDNDGDSDLAVGNDGQNRLFINNGNCSFNMTAEFGANSTIAMAWADFDLDGDLDMAVGNGILNSNQQNYLYINNGNGSFDEVAKFGVNQTDSLVWGDIDSDGDPDLAVGNGGFAGAQQNLLFINQGGGSFTQLSDFGMGDTASVAFGDADNDGDLDLAVGNWNGGQNMLYVNNGDTTFSGQAQFGMRDPNTVAWGDIDHNGYLDLVVGNGDFETADQNYAYMNNGDGTFSEVAAFGLGSTDSLALGDYDNDGDLDVAAGNEHSPTQNYLYENPLDDTAYLHLRLIGRRHMFGAGYSNRDGIGAKIYVYASGSLGVAEALLGFREMEAHGGFTSQNGPFASFGLPGEAVVDVHVEWPGSGGDHIGQDLLGVAVGQVRTVVEISGEEPSVPTVSEWGLVSFALLILAGGTIALRRDRPMAR